MSGRSLFRIALLSGVVSLGMGFLVWFPASEELPPESATSRSPARVSSREPTEVLRAISSTTRQEVDEPIESLRPTMIQGAVVDKWTMAPVAGVRVTALSSSGNLGDEDTTCSSGEFSLELEHDDTYSIAATLAGYLPARCETPSGIDRPLFIELWPSAVLTGSVRARITANPVEARLRVWWVDPMSQDPGVLTRKTDAQGRFEIGELPAGIEIRVSVEGGSYATALERLILPRTGMERILNLDSGTAIWGTCAEGNGTPIEGVRVVLMGATGPSGEGDRQVSVTNHEGLFSFGHLRHGYYELVATHEDRIESRELLLGDGVQPVDGLDVVFTRATPLNIRLRYSDNRPAEGVLARVLGHAGLAISDRSDSRGELVIPDSCRGPNYFLEIGGEFDDGVSTEFISMDRAWSTDTTSIEVREIPTSAVQFHFDPEPKGGELVLEKPSGDGGLDSRRFSLDNGSAVLKLESGRYLAALLVDGSTRWSTYLEIDAPKVVRSVIQWPTFRSISGRVLTAESHSPIEGASVFAESPDGKVPHTAANTDATGEFTVVVDSQYLPDLRVSCTKPGLVQVAGSQAEFMQSGSTDLTLSQPLRMTSPASIHLLVPPESSGSLRSFRNQTWVEVAGRISGDTLLFDNLSPGTYQARSGGEFRMIELAAGALEVVDLRFPNQAQWTVHTETHDGNRVENWIAAAALSTTNLDQSWQATIAHGDELQFFGVPEGDYVIVGMRGKERQIVCEPITHLAGVNRDSLSLREGRLTIDNSTGVDIRCTISLSQVDGVNPARFFGQQLTIDSFSVSSGKTVERTGLPRGQLILHTETDVGHSTTVDVDLESSDEVGIPVY